MLTELAVENFALVEKLRIHFGPGLNLLTGETGAGKSILLGALGMVLGERTGVDCVRYGSDRARVEAVFTLDGVPAQLLEALDTLGIEAEEGTLILTRELQASGKSTARINGRIVTVGTLKAVGDVLVDIHGQHAHQSLLQSERHVEILDAWAESEPLRAKVHEAYQARRAIEEERANLLRDARERARNLDLLAFQRDEIDAAALRPGEEEEAAAERARLAGAERLHAAANAAYEGLRSGALDALSRAVAEIERAARIDERLKSLLDTLQCALYGAEDAAREARSYRDAIEFNPVRLDEIEARLDQLKTLKRKYGDSIEEILAYRQEISGRLDVLENADARLADLEASLNGASATLDACARRLTDHRTEAASGLASSIQNELGALAMAATRFAVAIEPCFPGPGGADTVEFLISPNPGEPLKPLAKIASGGEISRVMLALKSVLARMHIVPTLVFDEVDSGIGGRTAGVLAEKLRTLADAAQVVCITHLPQVAARGQTHFFIEKRETGGRTTVSVTALDAESRVGELARMLGGGDSEAVLAHARELVAAP